MYFMAALLTSLGISIHAPREGGDQQNTHSQQQDRLFQSTPPARGATRWSIQSISIIGISIHAPREGGDHSDAVSLLRQSQISIHAPREGGDRSSSSGHRTRIISIHAPREGGDNKNKFIKINIFLFQSTPPARGATQANDDIRPGISNFNPRPPRGGRPTQERKS